MRQKPSLEDVGATDVVSCLCRVAARVGDQFPAPRNGIEPNAIEIAALPGVPEKVQLIGMGVRQLHHETAFDVMER
ncbi:hypothetical protein [Lichenifustis flavocetrariae]|uniref:Uncharacterized protein n=1 Tax=Lichenifustis flavocetrariae TaxID=2949735 RepID=A0AA41Z479_9HYPH|nr:hypothetical protein [Lichenifustis flavocetrariae]MCW6512495.1 hypothetical protein [Lichenifustis flavocetrariae]